MSISRWIVSSAAALMLPLGLLAADVSSVEPAPRVVGNPYYRVSVSKVEATTNTGAANSPAAIPIGATLQHVVYPAATTQNWTPTNTTPTHPISSNDGATRNDAALLPARALPRNRAAALGAAVRVATLAEAYPANVAAIDVPQAPAPSMPAPQVAASSIEPARFAPAANAAQMPIDNTKIAGARYDAAVRPVAWTSDVVSKAASDAPTYRSPASRIENLEEQQAGNPLRSALAERQATRPQPTMNNGATGNPLR